MNVDKALDLFGGEVVENKEEHWEKQRSFLKEAREALGEKPGKKEFYEALKREEILMNERTIFKPLTNVPTEITFRTYNEGKRIPSKFKNEDGSPKEDQMMYTVEVGGKEMVWYASLYVVDKIKELLGEKIKDKKVIVEKSEEQVEGKTRTRWHVITDEVKVGGLILPSVVKEEVEGNDFIDMELCLKGAKEMYDKLKLPYDLGLVQTANTLFINRRD